MEEKKPNSISQNLKYIYLIVGILVLLCGYLFGFKPYNDKASDLQDEITDLEDQRDSYEAKAKDKKEYETRAEEAEAKYDKVLALFDGGLSLEGQVFDCCVIERDNVGLSIKNISMKDYSNDAYVFGQVDSSDKSKAGVKTGVSKDSNFKAVSRSYTLTVEGTYEQVMKMFDQIQKKTGKRKSISTINITSDQSVDKLSVTLQVDEYAITGTGRTEQKYDPTLLDPATGTSNLFYSTVLAQQTPQAAQ